MRESFQQVFGIENSLIKEEYSRARQIQDKYFQTGQLTDEEFFHYQVIKASVALLRSADEANPKIKARLRKKYEIAYGQPLRIAIRKFHQDLAESAEKHADAMEAIGGARRELNRLMLSSDIAA